MKKKLLFSSCLLAALAFPATMSADDLGPEVTLTFNVPSTAVSAVTVTAESEDIEGITATLNSVKYGTTDKSLLNVASNTTIVCANQNGNTATAASPLTYNFIINGLPEGYKIENFEITTAACNSTGGYQDTSQTREFNVTASVGETTIASWTNLDISKGNVQGLNSFVQVVSNPYVVEGTDPISLTITAYKGSNNGGCFFGIESISFNYVEPEPEPEPVVFTYEGIKYQVLDENAKTVMTYPGTGYGSPGNVMNNKDKSNAPAFEIPQTVTNPDDGQEYTVTQIGYASFTNYNYNNYFSSITLPSTITEIGQYAFAYCDATTQVTILAETPPTVGGSAFSDVGSKTLVVPEGSREAYQESYFSSWTIYEVGEQAIAMDFEYNGIWYTIIDKDAKTLRTKKDVSINIEGGSSMGTGNNSVSGVVEIPATIEYYDDVYTVIEIGEGSFFFDEDLTSISIPGTVESIEFAAFAQCTGLKSITLNEGLYIVEKQAFYTCDAVSEINLPSTLEMIGDQGFAYCDAVKSFVLPAGAQNLGDGVFLGCTGLESFTSYVATPPTLTSEYQFLPQGQCPLYLPKDYIQAYAGTSSTDAQWSYYFEKIVPITFEDGGFSYTYLNNNNEAETTAGTLSGDAYTANETNGKATGNLVIPETVEFNGAKCNVIAIGEGSFANVEGLTDLTLPGSIEYLGASAFDGVQFESVTSNAETAPECGENAFNMTNWCTLYVLPTSVDSYEAADVWKNFTVRPIGWTAPEYDINDVIGYYNASFTDYRYTEYNPTGVEISLDESEENSVKIANLIPGYEGYYVVGTFDPYNNTISVPYDWVYEADGTASDLVVVGDDDNFERPALFTIEDGVITLQDMYLYVYDAYWDEKDDYYEIDMYDLVLTKVESVTISISGDDTAIASVTLNGEDVDDFTAIEAAPGDELEITFNEVGSGAALVVTVNDEPVEVKDNACTITVSTVDLDIEVTVDKSVGVNALEQNGQEVIYNLQGVRVDRSRLTKGVYIINGKKVMVK